jgi:hypothetical protein
LGQYKQPIFSKLFSVFGEHHLHGSTRILVLSGMVEPPHYRILKNYPGARVFETVRADYFPVSECEEVEGSTTSNTLKLPIEPFH